ALERGESSRMGGLKACKLRLVCLAQRGEGLGPLAARSLQLAFELLPPRPLGAQLVGGPAQRRLALALEPGEGSRVRGLKQCELRLVGLAERGEGLGPLAARSLQLAFELLPPRPLAAQLVGGPAQGNLVFAVLPGEGLLVRGLKEGDLVLVPLEQAGEGLGA